MELCKKSILFIKKHYLEVSVALLLVILVITLLIVWCLRRKKKKAEDLRTKLKTPLRSSKPAQDCASSSTSSFEQTSPLRSFDDKIRESISKFDCMMMSRNRAFAQKRTETKRLLSSDESDDESEDLDGTGRKTERTRAEASPRQLKFSSAHEDLAGRIQVEAESSSEDDSEEEMETERTDTRAKTSPRPAHFSSAHEDLAGRMPVEIDSSEEEFGEVRLIPKCKSLVKIEETRKLPVKGRTPSRKTEPPSVEQPEEKHHKQNIQKAKPEPTEKIKDTHDPPAAAPPTVRRLSQWIQNVFKPSRSPRDEEEGGSPPESFTLFTKSSLDKTITSRKRHLPTFSRRKEAKKENIDSDNSLGHQTNLPIVHRSDLVSRIATTGDSRRIDDMLQNLLHVSCRLQTPEDKEESPIQHSLEERKKVERWLKDPRRSPKL